MRCQDCIWANTCLPDDVWGDNCYSAEICEDFTPLESGNKNTYTKTDFNKDWFAYCEQDKEIIESRHIHKQIAQIIRGDFEW